MGEKREAKGEREAKEKILTEEIRKLSGMMMEHCSKHGIECDYCLIISRCVGWWDSVVVNQRPRPNMSLGLINRFISTVFQARDSFDFNVYIRAQDY